MEFWIIPLSTVLAALLAGVVGVIELVTRYKDAPFRALQVPSAWAYVLINAFAGGVALLMLVRYAPGLASSGGKIDFVRAVIISGLGALAALRFSVFKLRTDGGEEISLGPALVIERLLGVVDRDVDRTMAKRRVVVARELLINFSFAEHNMALVTHCLTLLQNVPADEQQRIAALATGLASRKDLKDKDQARALIMGLLGLVGEDVLRMAVAEIAPLPAPLAPAPPSANSPS